MPLSTSNRAQLVYKPEVSFGTNPGGNGTALRFTGESLAYAITSDTSKEIRSDRQTTDLVLTGASASGGVNFELSYKEFDPLFQAAFMGTQADFGTAGMGVAAAVGINSTAGTLTWGAAPTGNDALTGLAVGQWFRFKAPGDAADGAYLKIASRTTTVITVDTQTPIPGTGTRAAVPGCQVNSSRLVNGTVERSFTVERGLTDVNQFFQYLGMTASKLSMNFQSGSIVTGSLDFVGKNSVRSGATTLGTPTASQVFDVMNAVSGVGNVLENGAPLANTFIKSLKFDLDNKLRGRDAIGTLGSVSVGPGTLAVKGEMEIYLADGTMYDKFVNNTASSITWSAKDGAGNGYVLQFPKVKYSDAKVQAGGLDQDVMLQMPFTALMDTVTGKTIIMDRLGVA